MPSGTTTEPVPVKSDARKRLYRTDCMIYLSRGDRMATAQRCEPFAVVDAAGDEDITASFHSTTVEP